MRNKIILAIAACVLAAAFVLGVTGNITLAKEETPLTGKDRLVGVFITREYLDMFDYESYFEDNTDKILSGGEIGQDDSAKYQGRLYAVLKDEVYKNPLTGESTVSPKYVFEGVEGIGFFAAEYESEYGIYRGVGGNEAISDSNSAFISTDEGDSVALSGTVYVSTSAPSEACFYFNPVYQSADGQVYAVTGNGAHLGGCAIAGMSTTTSIKEEEKVKVGDEEESITSSVEVTIEYMDAPAEISILQFDKNSAVINKQDYAANALPDGIFPANECEYIVVETRQKNNAGEETTVRELFEKEEQNLYATIYAFYCREDGICIKKYCNVDWDAERQT